MEVPHAHSRTLDECEAVWVPSTHAHWEWSEMVEVVLFDLLPHPVHPGAGCDGHRVDASAPPRRHAQERWRSSRPLGAGWPPPRGTSVGPEAVTPTGSGGVPG